MKKTYLYWCTNPACENKCTPHDHTNEVTIEKLQSEEYRREYCAHCGEILINKGVYQDVINKRENPSVSVAIGTKMTPQQIKAWAKKRSRKHFKEEGQDMKNAAIKRELNATKKRMGL